MGATLRLLLSDEGTKTRTMKAAMTRAQTRSMRWHLHAAHAWGERLARARPAEAPDAALLARGAALQSEVLAHFEGLRAASGERVLLVTPPSAAGAVWFEDLRCALQHLGVTVLRLADVSGMTPAVVADFRPTMLLGLETDALLKALDAARLEAPGRCTRLLIPARDVAESHTPLTPGERRRIDRTAHGGGADIWLSLHAEPFMRHTVGDWLATGRPLLWLAQAASPFRDRPLAQPRVADYAHLSVANPARVQAVWATLRGVLPRYRGLFGERDTWGFGLARQGIEAHARSQASARVSLAPLVAPLLAHAGDLTQRVYAAAASGTFQVTELSPLTRQHFDADELVAVPRAPGALQAAFERWLDDREGRERIAARALERVYRDHTSLHRAQALIDTVRAWR